jgi:ectoine hydroxylase-related dioxygenase (phytanoyl-CoA dioxygenase family)
VLTQDQIAFYNSQGYLVVPEVLAPSELQALRDATRELEEQAAQLDASDHRFQLEPERGNGRSLIYRVLDPILLHPTYERMMQHPRVVDLIADLFGSENIKLHHTKMFTKYPEKGSAVHWHQDFAYFPHTNFDLLAVMVMLDDSTEENGCLQVVPGSHRDGPIGHAHADPNSAAVLDVGDMVRDRTKVPVIVPAGGVSVHHCCVLHGSAPNRSERPRRAFIVQYAAGDNLQLGGRTDHAGWGRFVRGADPHRVRLVAGTWHLPQASTDPRKAYRTSAAER